MAIDTTKTIVLVTGANRGIGLEIVKQLLESAPLPSDSGSRSTSGAPYHIYLCSRGLEKGQTATSSLKAQHGNSVSALELDVTSPTSIATAVKEVETEAGRIDILINNAGIVSHQDDPVARLREVLDANLISAHAVTHAFQPLLVTPAPDQKDKRIVNVSSDLGSITWRYDVEWKHFHVPAAEYRISKAGMNMMTACQNFELGGQGVRAFAFNPGYTATSFTDSPEGRRARGAWDPSECVPGCVDIVEGRRDGDVGKMIELVGTAPW